MATRPTAPVPGDSKWWPHFVQLDPFPASWRRLALGDEELRELEWEILGAPGGAPVVAGTAGLRKIRFSPRSWRRGKSGSIRVYYALFPAHGTVLLVFAHD